jgi:hypothetical protein
MYVNSPEGLKIRSDQTLNSTKLAVVPNRLPLKIIKLGNIETIDTINAPWIEILIPCYLWAECGTHYGWIFGGYLSKSQPDFTTNKWTSKNLEQYLINKNWVLDSDDRIHFIFYSDGTYCRAIPETDIGEFGTWKAISKNEIEFNRQGIMHDVVDESFSLELEFYPDGSFSNDTDYYHIGFDYFDDSLSPSFYYTNKYGENYIKGIIDTSYFYNRSAEESKIPEYKDKAVRKAIEVGVSAEGTKYADLYQLYWKNRENPSWEH